jgi:hypothetical protein
LVEKRELLNIDIQDAQDRYHGFDLPYILTILSIDVRFVESGCPPRKNARNTKKGFGLESSTFFRALCALSRMKESLFTAKERKEHKEGIRFGVLSFLSRSLRSFAVKGNRTHREETQRTQRRDLAWSPQLSFALLAIFRG